MPPKGKNAAAPQPPPPEDDDDDGYVTPTEAEIAAMDDEEIKEAVMTERVMQRDTFVTRRLLFAQRQALQQEEKELSKEFKSVTGEMKRLDYETQYIELERELLQKMFHTTRDRHEEVFAQRVVRAERRLNNDEQKWYVEACELHEDDVIAANQHRVKEDLLRLEVGTARKRAQEHALRARETILLRRQLEKELDLRLLTARELGDQLLEHRQRMGTLRTTADHHEATGSQRQAQLMIPLKPQDSDGLPRLLSREVSDLCREASPIVSEYAKQPQHALAMGSQDFGDILQRVKSMECTAGPEEEVPQEEQQRARRRRRPAQEGHAPAPGGLDLPPPPQHAAATAEARPVGEGTAAVQQRAEALRARAEAQTQSPARPLHQREAGILRQLHAAIFGGAQRRRHRPPAAQGGPDPSAQPQQAQQQQQGSPQRGPGATPLPPPQPLRVHWQSPSTCGQSVSMQSLSVAERRGATPSPAPGRSAPTPPVGASPGRTASAAQPAAVQLGPRRVSAAVSEDEWV